MDIAVTGGTGFLGRYIINRILHAGHRCRCWYRPESDRGGFHDDGKAIAWIAGGLHEPDSIAPLIDGAQAVVHAGLYRPPVSAGHRGADLDVAEFVQINVVGTLDLIQASRRARVGRFVFISTCSVHDVILEDRPLDETHPLWPLSHYGAHKAAIEKFVHSFGLPYVPDPTSVRTHKHIAAKEAWAICSLRPVGIYGLRRPIERGKWFRVVRDVMDGALIDDPSGGKEVHAEDVAAAVDLLLHADPVAIAGQSYNCSDLYVAAQEVAQIAKTLTGSSSEIVATNRGPRHQIDSSKIEALGMRFSGRRRLEQYVGDLVEAVRMEGGAALGGTG